MIISTEFTPARASRPPHDDVGLTLKNLEFTIESYLLANGTRLDLQTRVLLAGVRDCVGRVADVGRT